MYTVIYNCIVLLRYVNEFSISHWAIHAGISDVTERSVWPALTTCRRVSHIPINWRLSRALSARRTTGCGFVSGTFRLGGLLGSVAFSSLVSASRAVPMLTTAAVLLVAGIVSLKLAETHVVLL
jgi:hypothetical protein